MLPNNSSNWSWNPPWCLWSTDHDFTLLRLSWLSRCDASWADSVLNTLLQLASERLRICSLANASGFTIRSYLATTGRHFVCCCLAATLRCAWGLCTCAPASRTVGVCTLVVPLCAVNRSSSPSSSPNILSLLLWSDICSSLMVSPARNSCLPPPALLDSILTDSELGRAFVVTFWYNMCFLPLSLSSSLSLSLSCQLCACVSLFFSLSFQLLVVSFFCVLGVWMCMWRWSGVGYGVSREFSRYYSTRGWGRFKAELHSTNLSSEPSAFVTCLDLSWFPHWFATILVTWVWFVYVTRCWVFLYLGAHLYWTSEVLSCFVDMNRHYATQSRGRSRSRYREPWMGRS